MFPLAARRQRFVSLDIYEEIEQCRLVAGEQEQEKEQPSFEVDYRYNLITTVDVAVPWGPYSSERDQQGCEGSWAVEVRFQVDQNGVLTFRVEEPEQQGAELWGAGKPAAAVGDSRLAEVSLLVIVLLLIAAYVAIKVTIEASPVGNTNILQDAQDTSSNTSCNNFIDSGG